jgi:uncharacterized protein (DUF1684 family)
MQKQLGKTGYWWEELLRVVVKPSILIAVSALSCWAQSAPSTEQWRRDHEATLKADGGWLTVTGLFWLRNGANTVGSDAADDIVLPRGSERAGAFELRDNRITFVRPVQEPVVLRPDSEDAISQDGLSMFVIQRGDRYAIRLKDSQSNLRQQFTGLRWYPVKEDYLVNATFVPNKTPRVIAITNVLGQTEDTPSPGYVVFKLHGRQHRLEPVLEGNQFFFIFRDLTSGKETYPAGRFLYTDLPSEGRVVLDFNKAENPPCAFTPYATCPLPPPQNRLQVHVEAGELNYEHPE